MQIPINRDYEFTVRVLEEDSLNPQDLTGVVNVVFSVTDVLAPGVAVLTVNSTDVLDAKGYWSTGDDMQKTTKTEVVVTDADGILISSNTSSITENGVFNIDDNGTVTVTVVTDATTGDITTTTITLSVIALQTGMITFLVKGTSVLVESRGEAVDGYYLKAGYRGSIAIDIPDRPDVNVFIESIYAVKVG